MGIIKNAPPIDCFIIMESNQISGFQYVFGPEKDIQKLAQAIRGIKHRYLKREFSVDPALYRELRMSQGGSMGNPGGAIMALGERKKCQAKKSLTFSGNSFILRHYEDQSINKTGE